MRKFPASTQPIYDPEHVNQMVENCPNIIGADTALIYYQQANNNKDYKRKDEIVAKAKELGYQIGFNGKEYQAYRISGFDFKASAKRYLDEKLKKNDR